MHTVNKQGVQIEQCQNCRGIFLDHGELEHILSAEQRYYGGAPQQPAQYQPPGGPGGHYSDSPRPYRGDQRRGYYSDSPRPYSGHRKQKSFLDDLFG